MADALLARGMKIGVVGRSKARLVQFEGHADIWEGSVMDRAFMTRALQQATGLFLTLPDEAFMDMPGSALKLAESAKSSNLSHIVNISNSILMRGGTYTRLVAMEQELNKYLRQHILHVRSANFFENLNWGLHTPYRPDLKLPYISSFEVAESIAQRMVNQDFAGSQVKALLGERDYSMAELAAACGETCVQLPYTPENIAFFKPFNDGDFVVTPRDASNTTVPAEERFTLGYFLQHQRQKVQEM